MKTVKKIAILLGIASLLIASIGILFSTHYEDEVKAYLVKQINENTNTKIDVKEIHFSVFKKFPYASLEFRKVIAEEAIASDQKGTLFSAQSIFLQFNVIDILRKNYSIKKVHVENGIVNIRIDDQGNDNYHFWKENNDESPASINIELEDLYFKEVTFYFVNDYKDIDMAIEAVKLSLSGNLAENKFTLKTRSELFVHQINNQERPLLKDKSIYLNTSLVVNQNTQLYTITKGEISVADLAFKLTGNIKGEEDGVDLNISSKGSNLAITALFSLFPKKQNNIFNNYESVGNIAYSATIKGKYSSKKSPSVDVDFNILEGEIIEKESNNALTNLTIIGNYTNGDKNSLRTSKIDLKELEADFGPGHISGNYIISNFSNPHIKLNSKATIDMQVAKDFFKLDTIKSVSGQLNIDLKYQGNIEELSNITTKDLQKLEADGIARLNDIDIQFKNGGKKIEHINAVLKFDNNSIQIDTFNLKINQSDFQLQGTIKNLLPYLYVENETLSINAKMYSSKLVIDDLLLDNNKNDSSYSLHLPKDIHLSFIAKVDTFQFRKFRANQFKGNIRLDHQVLNATQLYFNAMEGSLKGDLTIDNSKNEEILVTSTTNLNRINVHQLFNQFENFGQDYILQENLNGNINADIEFAAIWDKNLTIDKDQIYVFADMVITNGELINYQPIMAMSKFIEVEELEKIKFSTLATKIKIKDQTVFIPKTAIKSSAIDLTISGTHTFNNHIDYRFKLLMNDILWGKS